MNLGVLLSLGDTLEKQAESGQFERFEKFYLEKYAENFNKVFVASYGKDSNFSARKTFILIKNKFNLQRYLYTFLLPFLARKNFQKTSVFRCMQTTGAIPAILAKIFYQIPFVATYGYKYHQFAKIEGKFVAANFLKILELLALKAAGGIIVTTQELQNYVGQFTSKEKIFVIPNGVDTKTFYPVNKKFDKQNIQIISIGRLEIQKNYVNLIKAIAASKYKDFITLTFIGKGSLKNQLENLAKKLFVKLKIIDSLPHALMPKFLQKADIFVLPSLIEGHPKVLLEALSCGLPAIASKVSGNIEVIQDGKTGLLCEIESHDIAQKIDILIENGKLRGKISQDGRRYILKYYDLDKLVTKEIEILKKLAKHAYSAK